MLKQRVITALVLLAILLPALCHPNPLSFSLIVLVLMTAGAWEWGRLNGLRQTGSIAIAAICLVLCLGSWQAGWLTANLQPLWLGAGAVWVLGSAWLVRAGVPGWAPIPKALRLVLGIVALWLAWLAVVQAKLLGVNFLLSVLALVWVADIGAYFSGRAFGLRFTKVKLAPAISPGKSWEGAWGGAIGVLIMAGLWVWSDAGSTGVTPSFHTLMFQHGWWLLLVTCVFMTAMSVIGDLVESLIKRSAGVKDSSQLLPGHGGVLDRIDALLPTLPLAMMLTSLVQK